MHASRMIMIITELYSNHYSNFCTYVLYTLISYQRGWSESSLILLGLVCSRYCHCYCCYCHRYYYVSVCLPGKKNRKRQANSTRRTLKMTLYNNDIMY